MLGKDNCPHRFGNSLEQIVAARARYSGGFFMGLLGSDKETKFCNLRVEGEAQALIRNHADNNVQGGQRIDFCTCLFIHSQGEDCIVAKYFTGIIDRETYVSERAKLGFPIYNTTGE